MTEEWLERQEGPDGQFADLLTRLPYDRQRMIETSLTAQSSPRDIEDVCLRTLWWDGQVMDTLTGEMTTDVGRAAAEVIKPWRERAVQLYTDWYAQAFPGPKESTRTGRQRSTSTSRAASATSESRSSAAGRPAQT